MIKATTIIAAAFALTVASQAQAGGLLDNSVEKATLSEGHILMEMKSYEHPVLENESVALVEQGGTVIALKVQVRDGAMIVDTAGHAIQAGATLRLSSVENGTRIFSKAVTL